MNHRGQRALRMGDYKYLRVDGHDYLFNIPADERERANLGKHQPEKLQSLREAWEAWDTTVPPSPKMPPSVWATRSKTCRSAEAAAKIGHV
jgi:arylsulfatase A-like enzyme